MKLVVETVVRAPLPRVWAWWTDYGKPGESFVVDHGNGTGIRSIEANDGKVVVFTDASPLAGEIKRRVEILEDHRLRDVGEGKRPFVSDWSFVAVDEGTRVRRFIEFRHPVAEMLGPIGRALASRLIKKDLVAHARQCEAEVG